MKAPTSAMTATGGVSCDEAAAAWHDACRRAGAPEHVDKVRMPVAEALGRVTAEPV